MAQQSASRRVELALLALVATILCVNTANAQMKGNFDAADANHDGRVTLQEFESYATQQLMSANGFRAQRFREMSPQQQQAVLQKRFTSMDHGSKGYLDRGDWTGS